VLIIVELAVPAIGYWLLALLVTGSDNRYFGANPLKVIKAARCLGFRTVAATGIASVVVLGHALLGVVAIEQLHRNAALGFLLLAVCWTSGLFLGTFTLRMLGLWYYRCQQRQSKQKQASEELSDRRLAAGQ
jgi:hypothetical protein